ncbi:MAG TPA: ATP-dependent Clp protease adapter ClpS [Thermodesulfobacteriota bacterium]|jgi:ATP-dependent Clp protease adaptor protein ClpS|nr:ATP-dependent Clp protease adapter ClpS [Thermodesulfobacteriota bacterium]
MEDRKIKSWDWEGDLLTEERAKLKRPDMYRIVLLNDDYTPREFVVWVLMRVFFKNENESTRIMLEAHTSGQSMVGVYTYDVATTKIIQVDKLAKQYEHPLKCILEVETGGEEE